ncbi:hypothetical protein BIW11_11543 [Tropilaelaps mercedesae]|uniref:Uncharacterized protein n=1 Tax=Tropilaelaps mercedesae TaxID=418985 RepID=A0A1V9XB11_9ACAR|nr:hypothetical protein BIW11_11543 [Tropilaelaps mercedesae]
MVGLAVGCAQNTLTRTGAGLRIAREMLVPSGNLHQHTASPCWSGARSIPQLLAEPLFIPASSFGRNVLRDFRTLAH